VSQRIVRGEATKNRPAAMDGEPDHGAATHRLGPAAMWRLSQPRRTHFLGAAWPATGGREESNGPTTPGPRTPPTRGDATVVGSGRTAGWVRAVAHRRWDHAPWTNNACATQSAAARRVERVRVGRRDGGRGNWDPSPSQNTQALSSGARSTTLADRVRRHAPPPASSAAPAPSSHLRPWARPSSSSRPPREVVPGTPWRTTFRVLSGDHAT
jgi:hypothetical protein